mmetsp:Transcript_6864/g.15743  ORF Transcript_6864/g.15743 Transcript_6864/m.15743 type:complete len:160 (-) Transcript_6864:210-689(-)
MLYRKYKHCKRRLCFSLSCHQDGAVSSFGHVNGGMEHADDQDKSNSARGGYKCSKCGLPKKGHICAYQPRLKRRDEEESKEKADMSTQVELDPEMTVRGLDLLIQGTPESYKPAASSAAAAAAVASAFAAASSSSSSRPTGAPAPGGASQFVVPATNRD